MNKLKPFRILCLAFLITACVTKEAPVRQNLFESLFIPQDSGFFRGHSIGDSPKIVMMHEDAKALISSDSLLTFQMYVPAGEDSIDIRLYYAFDSFGLFEIQADMYVSHLSPTTPCFAQVDSGLTQSYGQARIVGETSTWTTVSPSNNRIEITLGPDLDDNDIAFLSLNLLEPLDDAL